MKKNSALDIIVRTVVFVIVFTFVPSTVNAQSTKAVTDYSSVASTKHGYNCLPAKLRTLYNSFINAAEKFESSEQFYNCDNPMEDKKCLPLLECQMTEYYSDAEIVEAYDYFRWDFPEYFWLARSIIRSNYSGRTKVTICVGDYYKKASQRVVTQNSIVEVTRQWVGELTQLLDNDDTNDDDKYAIAYRLHDMILDRVDYSYLSDGKTPETADWAHSMGGVFTKTGAVCEGYSATFSYILTLLGIDNIQVCGESHIWNAIKLEDEWYFCDLTWDDLTNKTSRVKNRYFCMAATKDGFYASHTVSQVETDNYNATCTEGYRSLPSFSANGKYVR